MALPTNTAWSVGDAVTAVRLNQFSADIANLFKEVSSDNLSITYDIQGRCTQIVDNENTITVNIDWTDFDSSTAPKLYLQKVGDPKKWTVSYDAAGLPSNIIYA